MNPSYTRTMNQPVWYLYDKTSEELLATCRAGDATKANEKFKTLPEGNRPDSIISDRPPDKLGT